MLLLFMRILLTLLVLTIVCVSKGQSVNQKDLIEIFNVALRKNKLPDELIHATNPKGAPWTNAPFIVIKADKSKGRERILEPTDTNHVWVLDYAEIFMLGIHHGLVVLGTTEMKGRLTIDFKTVRYPSNQESIYCHAGRLFAQRTKETWTVSKLKMKRYKCKMDMFGLQK